MNINSKTFVPLTAASQPPLQVPVVAPAAQVIGRSHTDSVDPFDDFGGYKNPYSATIDIEKEKRKQEELEAAE